jgi:hypothetical protein
MFVLGLFLLYIFLTSVRLKRVAKSQTHPVWEVFLGWTFIFVVIGILVYPFFNTGIALSGIIVPAVAGGVIAIADLWLFEHRDLLSRIYQKYAYGKIGLAAAVVVVALVQLILD